jgi:ABC-2 type transport system ATP-binding protein
VRGAAAISVAGLTKYYGAVVGVEDLSFEVEDGAIYGFLGANGAGKTTTMRLLLDLLRPTSGRASIFGVDCHRDSLGARRLIGYLPGELPIYPDLTAAGYLDYLAHLDDRPVQPAFLRQLFERFDVSDLDLRRRLRDQSHGMKQKIGIIQALMLRPRVLILDEPTAGLDPLMAQAFRDTITAVRRAGDTTVFLSSHVLAEVESTCDRIGLVRSGRMVATETIATLKQRATRTVSVQFGAPPGDVALPEGVRLQARVDLRWTLEVAGPLGPLLGALASHAVQDLQIEPFRLEDYLASFYGVNVGGVAAGGPESRS